MTLAGFTAKPARRACWNAVQRVALVCAAGLLLLGTAAGAQESGVGPRLVAARPEWARIVPLDAALLPVVRDTTASVVPSFSRVLTGVGVGLVGTAVVGSVSYLYLVSGDLDNREGHGVLVAAALAVLVGYPAGAATGVYLHGARNNEGGSLLLTLGGAALGAVAGSVLAPYSLGVGYVLLVPYAAGMAYNASRGSAVP